LCEPLWLTVGDEFAVTSIFKPNAAVGSVVGDLRTLSKDLTKEDCVIFRENQAVALKETSVTKLRT
jgi:hypothetical protein